jgi:hypothetical protein
MKTQSILIGLTLVVTTVVLGLGCVAVLLLVDNRELRLELRDVRTHLERAGDEVRELKEERHLTQESIDVQRERMETMSAELAALSSAAVERETVRAVPRSYRVRAFMGQQEVGMGWMVASQVSSNGANGQLTYEPVIVLDDAVRQRVGVTQTNVVEREVSKATTVNYNYPYNYGVGWPVVWVAPHKRGKGDGGGSNGQREQPQPPPQVPSPYLSTRPWHPQTGFTQMAPGRPGGEWISSGTGGARPRAAAPVANRPTGLPIRY